MNPAHDYWDEQIAAKGMAQRTPLTEELRDEHSRTLGSKKI